MTYKEGQEVKSVLRNLKEVHEATFLSKNDEDSEPANMLWDSINTLRELLGNSD